MASRDIVTRAGNGTALNATQHDQNHNSFAGTVETQTGTTYTVVYTDQNKRIELDNATMTCTMDAVATITGAIDTDGWEVILKNINSADATIARTGADTFDGATSITLAQNDAVLLKINAAGDGYSIHLYYDADAPTLTGTETFTNKTFVAPALGTPASGVLTNCTGTAAGLTAGTVTTNANLTGDVTSVGNATTIAAGAVTFATSISKTAVSSSWSIPTATPQVVPAGVYYIYHVFVGSGTGILIEAIVNGAWRQTYSDTGSASQAVPPIISDGTNVRISAAGSTQTVYYRRIYG